MPPVSLAVIGYGIMGKRLVHAATTDPAHSVKLTGVWDPSEAALVQLSTEFPEVPPLASAEAAIAAADCVYIASPPHSHLAHARSAMAAGKAVFCEKPLAVDLEDASAFADEAAQQNARVAVDFTFASSLAPEQLKSCLNAGEIGTPQSIEIDVGFARWPRPWQVDAASWLNRRAEGGFTREVLSHFLFLSRRLGGPMTLTDHQVSYPAGDGAENAVTANLRAGDLTVRVCGAVGKTELAEFNSWTLTGSKGAIRLRDWTIAEKQDANGTWQPAGESNPDGRLLALHLQLAKVARMTGDEPQDLATVSEAFEVQQIVETMLREAE